RRAGRRGNRPELHRERHPQGAPRQPCHGTAGAGRRFRAVRGRARRRAGPVLGALRRRPRQRRRQHRPPAGGTGRRGGRAAHGALRLRAGAAAPPGGPAPDRGRGRVARPHPARTPRQRRARLRPGVPRSGRRSDRRGDADGGEEPHQPPRPGAGAAARAPGRTAVMDARPAGARNATMLTPPPLSLYVHMPWCVRKCPYCDFNSHPARGVPPYEAYVDALLADLDHDLPLAWRRTVHSVFFGGGTPSLFPADAIDRFLQGASARLRFAPDAEITLETNPGTVEHGRFADYRRAGVNRISLGVQSFDDGCLQRLGRIHDSGEAEAAVKLAQDAGLDNINLDLMYALPGQTPDMAVRDVERAVALAPAHISHYQLTLEPNTLFAARPPGGLPDEDQAWDMQERCQALLAEAGYAQYEVSAYARPGRQCAHNLN